MGGKSYTGKGDAGQSGTGDGKLARKSEPIFEAVGMLDELNANIGLARATGADKTEGKKEEADAQLLAIQSDLFEAGSFLSGYRKAEEAKGVFAAKLARLERWIDGMDAKLGALSNFILPGGSRFAAQLHLCRTTCRRAERRIEALDVPAKSAILPYINRLSSYFFARARMANKESGVDETVWKRE